MPTRVPIWVWPVLLIAGVVWFFVDMYRNGGGGAGSSSMLMMAPTRLLYGGMMLGGMAGMYRGSRGGVTGKKSRLQIEAARRDFDEKLDRKRLELHKAAEEQYEEIVWFHPHPMELASRIDTRRMWERQPGSAAAERGGAAAARRNFGDVRMGTGISQRLRKIDPPTQIPPPEEIEPRTGLGLREFLRVQPVIHGVPKPVALCDYPGLALFGDRDTTRAMVRAMVLQAAVAHAPGELSVAVVATETEHWEWVKWLPHARCETEDMQGPRRAVFASPARFREAFPQVDKAGKHMVTATRPQESLLLVIVDTDQESFEARAAWRELFGAEGRSGVCFLDLSGDRDTIFAHNRDTYFHIEPDGRVLHPTPSQERPR
ncbi:hypothetical protein P0W64_16555 [Tsukamurella sp. 8F]|nr:hypothetical protein [Tsukamurella sp. 8F]MDF0588393.1 hypothetical protein [Tsukamurella sp. 8F]